MRRTLIIIIVLETIGLALAIVLWPRQGESPEFGDPIGFTTFPSEDAVVTDESPASSRASEVEPDVEVLTSKVESTDDGDVLVITFPDGEFIQIAVRDPVYSIPTHPERLSEAYDSLRQKAEAGDADSALLLATVLDNCRYVARTQQDLDSTINRLYETHTFENPEGKEIIEVDTSKGIEPVEKSYRQSFARCRGISEAQIDESGRWLRLAADQGNEIARSTLFNRNPRDARAFEAAEAHWQAGGMRALHWLATYYRGSYGDDIVPQDPIRSFAYQYLATHVLLAKLRHDGSVSSAYETQELDELRIRGARLSPLDHDAAIDLAKSMLRENKNCCVAW